MIEIKSAEFIASFPNPLEIPVADTVEIVTMGRSNVGKSTLINRLTGRKKLAQVSATPGKTKLYNQYKIKLKGEVSQVHLIDFPGFGYAKFSKTERNRVSRDVVNFIRDRETLDLVLLLQDSRRTPGYDELTLRDLAFQSGCLLLVVVTKIDKLNRKETATQLKIIAETYSLEIPDLVLMGLDSDIQFLWDRILSSVQPVIS
jgi:GTP-binding protein